jgi:hypothetical protein
MTSPQDENPAIGNFTELSETDCKELLAQHTAGRIGFMAGVSAAADGSLPGLLLLAAGAAH